MKILFLIETIRPNGAERVTSIIAEQLADMSHDIFLICTGFEHGEKNQQYSFTKNVHVEFIPDISGNRLYLLFVRIHYLRKRIVELNPDCIISLAQPRSLFMISMAQIKSSIPLIFSERNDPSHYPSSKIERLLRLIAYWSCDQIVFQTINAKEFFPLKISRKGTVIENPITNNLPVVWNGVRKPYITTFCRLAPQKNLSLLLQAFALLSDDYPKLQLVIYGNGEMKNRLEEEAKQLNISSQTTFFPHSMNIHSLINDCLMYVSSSDYEGQSNAMLEAMAMGLPCVCTDCPCGGANAVIQNGINGLLVPVGDAEKLSEAMRYMLTHPEDACQMGRNASTIRYERRPEQIAKKWLNLIIKVTSEDN